MRISFNLSAFTLLFVALKLLGYIDWAWIWVLAPSWIPFVIIMPIALLYAFVVVAKKR